MSPVTALTCGTGLAVLKKREYALVKAGFLLDTRQGLEY
jgi:hypothetical protein